LKSHLTNWSGSYSHFSTNHQHITGDHASSDPSVEALYPVISTAIEFMSALEHTDATFNTSMPLATLLKPAPLFMSFWSVAIFYLQ
jgi:hypothetical protein